MRQAHLRRIEFKRQSWLKWKSKYLYKVVSRFVFTSIGIGGDPVIVDDVVELDVEWSKLWRKWEFASANEKWQDRRRMAERRTFSRSSLERNVSSDSSFSETIKCLHSHISCNLVHGTLEVGVKILVIGSTNFSKTF